MKLFSLRLTTLKSKLYAIVFASFVVRVVAFFLLPSTPSPLGPDEGTYASLAKWIGQSKPAEEFPAYGQGLYLSGRSIIIPASFLYRIGINELDAVRLASTLYGFCCLILVVTLILKPYKEDIADPVNENFNKKLIVRLVLVFAFLPSHFTWSNLGLRESATEFWMLATFGIFFLIYHFQKKITALGIVTFVASFAFTFSSRPQVGWVVGVSMIVYLLFNLNQVNTYFMIGLVVCGVLLGGTLNLGNTGSTGSTGSTGNLLKIFNPLTNAGEIVSYKHQANQLDAASIIQTQSCPRELPPLASTPPTKLDTYFCIAWRAPYMISTFLFRPIIGLDVTSKSSLIAASENLIWVSSFAVVLMLIIRKRHISFIKPLIPPIVFFVLYVSGASAYQGNMGTGFRHKSLILWVVLLVIFALKWRKPEPAPRNESA
jgi:hypothetical protein